MDLTTAILLGIRLASAAAQGIAAAQEGVAFVEKLVAEGRDPTPEEIADLRARSKSLHEKIQSS
ncbi:hypothetical protein [Ferrovibrio sp.]|uniref:hypothetical protein n=1 Tax=Ferrovibrio sp. TaxID=1917215 RepID=UPI0035B3D5C1